MIMSTEENQKKQDKKPEGKAIVERDKKEEFSPLKKLLQRKDVLLMLYPKEANGIFLQSIQPEDEITIYELLKDRTTDKKQLLILLDTSGGNVYSAVKIMDTLRTKYSDITIAIPQEAKSSGTMMCCGADRLIMGPVSELGPLDKPMIHPDDKTARISALDIVRSIDGMIDTAIDRQKQLAEQISNEFGVPIKASLAMAGDSISKLISPMLCREDVKIYNQAKRLLAIAETYGIELLNKHMLKYINKEKLRKRVAGMIIRRLVWLYPDHSFAIRRNELRDWFFIVDDAEKFNFWDELWKEFKQNIGSKHGKIIRFL